MEKGFIVSFLYFLDKEVYLRANDVPKAEGYTAYVCDKIAIGMKVRCSEAIENVQIGDIGTVIHINRYILLNVKV